MIKILNLIKKALYYFPIDKQLHYLYGYKIASIIFFFILVIPALTSTLRVWEIGVITAAISSFFGVGKELLDDKIDKKDIVATLIGIGFAIIQNTLLFYILLWTCREINF